jgi:uncharacterized protein (DUF4415 family)
MIAKKRVFKPDLASVKRRSKKGLKASLRKADLKALSEEIVRTLARRADQPRSGLEKLAKKNPSADHKISGRLMETLRETGANSTWVDPDDAPEWTDEMFERADLYHGDKLVRRGRPPSANPKKALKLRIDADVVEHFRATGPGWQTRINDTLRRAAKLKARA